MFGNKKYQWQPLFCVFHSPGRLHAYSCLIPQEEPAGSQVIHTNSAQHTSD